MDDAHKEHPIQLAIVGLTISVSLVFVIALFSGTEDALQFPNNEPSLALVLLVYSSLAFPVWGFFWSLVFLVLRRGQVWFYLTVICLSIAILVISSGVMHIWFDWPIDIFGFSD